MLNDAAAAGKPFKVREAQPDYGEMRISGLEPMTIDKNIGFVNVGERCNIAGSIKYKKLILNGDYDKALEIARAQAESGAQVIDVNMDEGLLDGECVLKTLGPRDLAPSLSA